MTDTPPQQIADAGPTEQDGRAGRGYLAESIGVFFSDPTWFKRALAGMVLMIVPVLGQMAVSGYSLMWMRETAWGTGDAMPSKPPAGKTLLLGLRVAVVDLVWLLLGSIPLFVSSLIATGLIFSSPFPSVDFTTGAVATSSTSPIVAEVFGIVIVALGALLFAACIVLARVGIARLSVYQRLSIAMPLSGQIAFVRAHPRGFWRALGTGLVASLPYLAIDGLVTATQSKSQTLTALGGLHWALYLPLGFAWFCAMMISARAFGRWLREIDPRTLPAFGAHVDAYGATHHGDAPQPPLPNDDPFSEADA